MEPETASSAARSLESGNTDEKVVQDMATPLQEKSLGYSQRLQQAEIQIIREVTTNSI